MTFWVPDSLATTISHPLNSNTMFAKIFKSVPMVFELIDFHCNCKAMLTAVHASNKEECSPLAQLQASAVSLK